MVSVANPYYLPPLPSATVVLVSNFVSMRKPSGTLPLRSYCKVPIAKVTQSRHNESVCLLDCCHKDRPT